MPWFRRTPERPVVDLRAYEDAMAEVHRLRAQNDMLTGQLVRLVRKEMGLPESSEKKPQPVLPADLRAVVQGWGSASTQKMEEDKLWRRYRDVSREHPEWSEGAKWDAVRAAVPPVSPILEDE